MLNGKFSNEMAESFSERLRNECQGEGLVDRAYWLAIGRAATAHERDKALQFLRSRDDDGALNLQTKEFALAMFNLNAFLYVE
jgi:hypothetical protein